MNFFNQVILFTVIFCSAYSSINSESIFTLFDGVKGDATIEATLNTLNRFSKKLSKITEKQITNNLVNGLLSQVYSTIDLVSGVYCLIGNCEDRDPVEFQPLFAKLSSMATTNKGLIECRSMNDVNRRIKENQNYFFQIFNEWLNEKLDDKKHSLRIKYVKMCTDHNHGLDRMLADLKFFLRPEDAIETITECIQYDSNKLKKWVDDFSAMAAHFAILVKGCEEALEDNFEFSTNVFIEDVVNILKYYSDIAVRKHFIHDDGHFGFKNQINELIKRAKSEEDLISMLRNKYSYYEWTAIFVPNWLMYTLRSVAFDNKYDLFCGSYYHKSNDKSVMIAWTYPNAKFNDQKIYLYKKWYEESDLSNESLIEIVKNIKRQNENIRFNFILLLFSNYPSDYCGRESLHNSGSKCYFSTYYEKLDSYQRVCTYVGTCGEYKAPSMELPSFRYNPIIWNHVNIEKVIKNVSESKHKTTKL